MKRMKNVNFQNHPPNLTSFIFFTTSFWNSSVPDGSSYAPAAGVVFSGSTCAASSAG
jgi:hypothetical protein